MSFLDKLFGARKSGEPTKKKVEARENRKPILSTDKQFRFNIKRQELKLISLYSSDPMEYISLLKVDNVSIAVLTFYKYLDPLFPDIISPFIENGSLKLAVYFEKLPCMGIEDAYLQIKDDLNKKDLLNDGDSIILFNTGFASKDLSGFLMLIGVMLVADGLGTIKVVSADHINANKVKIRIK